MAYGLPTGMRGALTIAYRVPTGVHDASAGLLCNQIRNVYLHDGHHWVCLILQQTYHRQHLQHAHLHDARNFDSWTSCARQDIVRANGSNVPCYASKQNIQALAESCLQRKVR